MNDNSDLPVHESLEVIDYENIYKRDEWWKSVVRYRYDSPTDHEEVAVYLWNMDGEWTRKNKYVIKTAEAWQTDRAIIDRLFEDTTPAELDEEFPASDYYTVGGGVTVFQSDGWWKAIVKIEQKGSYETEEIMVYLWQRSDGEWRRRQKYTIKSQSRWEEEVDVIESVLGIDPTDSQPSDPPEPSKSGDTGIIPPEFEELNREMDKHLSVTD